MSLLNPRERLCDVNETEAITKWSRREYVIVMSAICWNLIRENFRYAIAGSDSQKEKPRVS